jgi:NADPH:quinone reductase
VIAIAALHDGLMGVSRVEKAGLEPGDLVLVRAAGGSIAAWLLPLATRAGATSRITSTTFHPISVSSD